MMEAVVEWTAFERTLRDEFAGSALMGLLARENHALDERDWAARRCYDMAEALLLERRSRIERERGG